MNTVPPTATEQPAAPGDAARTYMRRGRDPAPDEIDWSAAPARFLSYTDCPVLPLPWASRTSERPDTELLGRLLRELCGLTRADWTRPMDPFTGRAIEGPPVQGVFRPAPSGGALYPIEVYLATGELPRVPAALHHYGVVHHSLRQVRSGDHRAALVDAVTAPPDQAPDVVLALTAVFWRSAFKYGEFAYRLLHQETGALLAQVRAVARLLGAESAVHLRFPDEKVNQLLGLDTFRQTATAVIALRHPALRAKSAAAAPSRSDLLHRPRAALAEPPHDVTSRLPITAALHAASLTEDPNRSRPTKSPVLPERVRSGCPPRPKPRRPPVCHTGTRRARDSDANRSSRAAWPRSSTPPAVTPKTSGTFDRYRPRSKCAALSHEFPAFRPVSTDTPTGRWNGSVMPVRYGTGGEPARRIDPNHLPRGRGRAVSTRGRGSGADAPR